MQKTYPMPRAMLFVGASLPSRFPSQTMEDKLFTDGEARPAEKLRHLPKEFLSHSFAHHHLEPFKGRHITVIGGGASALGLAGLLRDADCDSHLVVRESKVTFHDGETLTGVSAAPSLLAVLKQDYGEVSIEAGGQALVVSSDHAMPELLEELALPRAAIFRKSEANILIGTGPFRATAWEPGRRLTLAAFEDYWGGRPYLDAIAIEFGTERGHADLFDIPVGPTRRILPEGLATWSSEPRTLLAIKTLSADPALAQALALAIDRAPIANVLAQHKAEAAFGLLPQWLSGYGFLFQAAPDIPRARQLMSSLRPGTMSLGFPANDLFLRSVAERIALNARDAGMTIQPTSTGNPNFRLMEWQL